MPSNSELELEIEGLILDPSILASREQLNHSIEITKEYSFSLSHLFTLDQSEYGEYLKEGTLEPRLREKFEDEDYEVDKNAEIFEKKGLWFVSENRDEKYIIRENDEELNVYCKEKFDSATIKLPCTLSLILKEKKIEKIENLLTTWMRWYGNKNADKREKARRWINSSDFSEKIVELLDLTEPTSRSRKERKTARTKIAQELADSSKENHYGIFSFTSRIKEHLNYAGNWINIEIKAKVTPNFERMKENFREKLQEIKNEGIPWWISKIMDLPSPQLGNLSISDIVDLLLTISDP